MIGIIITVEAFQYESGDTSEQWADMFANYVAGNIDTREIGGKQCSLQYLCFSNKVGHMDNKE